MMAARAEADLAARGGHGDRVRTREIDADRAVHEAALVRLLRLACSGELAAIRAYQGHWRSLGEGAERDRIRQIEAEELRHRGNVLAMLERMGRRPAAVRERVMGCIGSLLGAFCHVTGWLAPMYGAAILETKNVKEYDDAAEHARRSGWHELVAGLVEMADVELEHELYFKAKVLSHPVGRLLPLPACTRAAVPAIAREP